MFLNCLIPRPLVIQIKCPRYLKESVNLPQYNWNTFNTIRDLLEGFSGKDISLYFCRTKCQSKIWKKKKSIIFKEGFPVEHDDYNSFLFVFETSRHPNDMFKASKSISGLMQRKLEYFWNHQKICRKFFRARKSHFRCTKFQCKIWQKNMLFKYVLIPGLTWSLLVFLSWNFEKISGCFKNVPIVFGSKWRYLEHVIWIPIGLEKQSE